MLIKRVHSSIVFLPSTFYAIFAPGKKKKQRPAKVESVRHLIHPTNQKPSSNVSDQSGGMDIGFYMSSLCGTKLGCRMKTRLVMIGRLYCHFPALLATTSISHFFRLHTIGSIIIIIHELSLAPISCFF